MKRILITLMLLVAPFAAHAGADLSINQNDVRFSTESLIAGDTVRIYASIYNVGDQDVSGYVTFFQGSVSIGDSQVISVLSGGNAEEVYVDFVVPSSSFNLRAEIRGTDPEDVNPDNNTTVTAMYEPVFDDDRDGVANDADNCPATANADQLDSDGDGLGDACDDDDDNDGLADSVEDELGTDTTNPDTDEDGTDDPDDAYPTDPTRTQIIPDPEPEPEPEPVEEKVTEDSLLSKLAEEVADDLRESGLVGEEVVDEPEDESGIENVKITLSPNALFRYERKQWNTFNFEVLGPESNQFSYEWDFGDGVTSSKLEVEHVYQAAGAYEATLTITSSDGEISDESITILVPFFTLENNLVLLAVIGLGILMIVGIGVIVSMVLNERKAVQAHMAKEAEEDWDEDDESIEPKRAPKKPKKKKAVKISVIEELDD